MNDDVPQDLIGSWQLTRWVLQVVGENESKPPYGNNPKGRLIITPQGDFMVIISGANRRPATTTEQKAALLDSVLAYAGKSTFEGNKIITTVDMSANEVFSGDKQKQVRFYEVKGDRLTIRTPEIASAVLPGKKTVGILEWVREPVGQRPATVKSIPTRTDSFVLCSCGGTATITTVAPIPDVPDQMRHGYVCLECGKEMKFDVAKKDKANVPAAEPGEA